VELTELASLYHRDVSEFLAEQEEEEDLLVAFHRVAQEARGTPEAEREVLRYAHLCREGFRLECQLGRRKRPGSPFYDMAHPASISAAAQQGAEIAEEERKRLGLGCAPIPD